jgi:hypothetical protein
MDDGADNRMGLLKWAWKIELLGVYRAYVKGWDDRSGRGECA